MAIARVRTGLGGQLDVGLFPGVRLARAGRRRLLVVVNYAPNQSQCYVRLPFADLSGSAWLLQDQLSATSHERDGSDLQARGLYVDAPPWQSSVFALNRFEALR